MLEVMGITHGIRGLYRTVPMDKEPDTHTGKIKYKTAYTKCQMTTQIFSTVRFKRNPG